MANIFNDIFLLSHPLQSRSFNSDENLLHDKQNFLLETVITLVVRFNHPNYKRKYIMSFKQSAHRDRIFHTK